MPDNKNIITRGAKRKQLYQPTRRRNWVNIPQELFDRMQEMESLQIDWSIIACEAFEAKLNEIDMLMEKLRCKGPRPCRKC